MGLSSAEREFLKNKVKELSNDAKIYLFGSRADDNKKGGDIDLLIVSKKITKKDVRKLRIDFFEKFGEQKIDIVMDDGSFENVFTKMIFEKAVEL
jgi:predicted nucleotidyltransferase